MKPIEQARADLNAAKASGEDDVFWAKVEETLKIGLQMKAAMIKHGKTVACAICPRCKVSGALHGRLAPSRRFKGGALRLWCDNCPDIRMME